MTDSIFGGVRDNDFHSLKEYRCVKRVMPELTKVFDHEEDFHASDFVIISCGINDLSCYNHSSDSLADLVCTKLADCCKRARGTTFIFNSLLHTRHKWLNEEVDHFNKIMFELSCKVENLIFF